MTSRFSNRCACALVLVSFSLSFLSRAGVVYVDRSASGANNGSSWTNAFTDLQSGIDAAAATATAANPNEVWVKKGVYKPNDPDPSNKSREQWFQLKNNVTVYGGFAGNETTRDQRDFKTNQTILSGDLNGDDRWKDNWGNGVQRGFVLIGSTFTLPPAKYILDSDTATDNCYHVIYHAPTIYKTGCSVDGLVLLGGVADGPAPHDNGGGICDKKSQPNSSHWSIENCTISASAGGAVFVTDVSLSLSACTIQANSSNQYGGGIGVQDVYSSSSLCVEACSVKYNISDYQGGGIFQSVHGGAILTRSTISGNASGGGGGVFSSRAGTIANCSISGNSATNGQGGGLLVDRDPVTGDYPAVDISSSTISENTAVRSGGGIWGTGIGTIGDCTISGNSSTMHGGGVYVHHASTVNCRIMSNMATQSGGGIYVVGGRDPITASQISVTILNSTISSNTSSARGGGVCTGDDATKGVIANCTIAQNLAGAGGGISVGFDPGYPVSPLPGSHAQDFSVINCTLSSNQGSGMWTGISPITAERASPRLINCILWNDGAELTGLGEPVLKYCLIQGGYPGLSNLSGDPLLGPLTHNGGPTQTMQLLAGSPAIDAGVSVFEDTDGTLFYAVPASTPTSYKKVLDGANHVPMSTSNCLNTSDQRGMPRIQLVDLGAYERQPSFTVIIEAGANGSVGLTGRIGTHLTEVVKDGEGIVAFALARDGYAFVQWDDGNTDNPRTVTVTGELTLTAQFASMNEAPVAIAEASPSVASTAGITVTLSGSGSYDPDNGPNPLTYSWTIVSAPGVSPAITDDDQMDASFTPADEGTYVLRLTVNDGADTDAADVQVVFGSGLHVIAVQAGTGSKVSLDGGTASASVQEGITNGGNSSTFTAIPDDGYEFDSWSDGDPSGSSRIFTNVTASVSVTANFKKSKHTVTFVVLGDGQLIGSTSQLVADGGSATAVMAVASDSAEFKRWTINGIDYTGNTLTLADVYADTTVTAVFESDTPSSGSSGGSGGGGCTAGLSRGSLIIAMLILTLLAIRIQMREDAQH